jgi:hypothetical protein
MGKVWRQRIKCGSSGSKALPEFYINIIPVIGHYNDERRSRRLALLPTA